MTISIMDKVLHMYPKIQRVSYWCTQFDGTPWDDPYDGLVWENEDVPKPTKDLLASIPDEKVMPIGARERLLHDVDQGYAAKKLNIASQHDIDLHTSRMAIKNLLPEEEVQASEVVLSQIHALHRDHHKLRQQIAAAKNEKDLTNIKNSYLY